MFDKFREKKAENGTRRLERLCNRSRRGCHGERWQRKEKERVNKM